MHSSYLDRRRFEDPFFFVLFLMCAWIKKGETGMRNVRMSFGG